MRGFFIERSEIRKKQHDFKSVHFGCRMVLFLHDMGEKSTFFSKECRKNQSQFSNRILSLLLSVEDVEEVLTGPERGGGGPQVG